MFDFFGRTEIESLARPGFPSVALGYFEWTKGIPTLCYCSRFDPKRWLHLVTSRFIVYFHLAHGVSFFSHRWPHEGSQNLGTPQWEFYLARNSKRCGTFCCRVHWLLAYEVQDHKGGWAVVPFIGPIPAMGGPFSRLHYQITFVPGPYNHISGGGSLLKRHPPGHTTHCAHGTHGRLSVHQHCREDSWNSQNLSLG